jgi:hypothetical protein
MDHNPFDQRHAAGLSTRRDVLGTAYVDKAVASADDFNREFQELLNTYGSPCWNDLWNRPGLPRQTGSLLNLAMLTVSAETFSLPTVQFASGIFYQLMRQALRPPDGDFYAFAIPCGTCPDGTCRAADSTWRVWSSK